MNSKKGEDVIIVPPVKDDEAKKLFPQGWKTLKPYLRLVKLAKQSRPLETKRPAPCT